MMLYVPFNGGDEYGVIGLEMSLMTQRKQLIARFVACECLPPGTSARLKWCHRT